MSNAMKRTEGGTGGRRGHSNMTHWDRTKAIKDTNRKARRANDRAAIKEQTR